MTTWRHHWYPCQLTIRNASCSIKNHTAAVTTVTLLLLVLLLLVSNTVSVIRHWWAVTDDIATSCIGCRAFQTLISGLIYPKLSYSEALEESGLVCLDNRREDITQSTFKELKCPTHPLHYMLPPRKVSTSQMTLRPTNPFSAPKCKKTRYGQDLIPYCIAKKY